MYIVEVRDANDNGVYYESFDAPDWQTALVAAAELAKIDDRANTVVHDCRNAETCHCGVESDSACDLDDESDACGCNGTPHHFGPSCRAPYLEQG